MKTILRLAGTALFCFFGCWFMFLLFRDGFVPLGIFVGAAVCFVTMIMLRKTLTAWRWLAAGIVMAFMFTVYPIFYTVYLSFTNMGGGHLLTKTQAIQRLSREMYNPDDGGSWEWTAYRRGNDYLLLLHHDNDYFTVRPGRVLEPFSFTGSRPAQIDGYSVLNSVERMQSLTTLQEIEFGQVPYIIKIITGSEAAVQLPVYIYNSSEDTFTDQRNGEVYRPVTGTFTSDRGNTLSPGFFVNIGLNNYSRFLSNPGYTQPIIRIIIWNICFSLFSVLISFGVGMMIAILFDDLKYKRIIRTLLILPYPIPVLVSIMIWRALLNDNLGLVTTLLYNIFGTSPQFFTVTGWTRFALIMLNVYLSYPYFYILTSGALRSIPGDLFEAAAIDGAGSFTVLRKITLPMVMRILAPLLIASFTFNFNNFTLVWTFNSGLPAIADAAVTMGHTDLLISFIYRLAFSMSSAPDYGFAASITVMLFVIVTLMVVFQTWNTKTIKEAK